MKQLKTPEEIFHSKHGDQAAFPGWAKELIISAQRDALECAAENAKCEYPYNVPIDKSSILDLLPK